MTGAAAAVLLLAGAGIAQAGPRASAGKAGAAVSSSARRPAPVVADTIGAALVRAYQDNAQLNAQRAQVRVTDETVPQALSGFRPKVALTASGGYQYSDTVTTSVLGATKTTGALAPRAVGATVTQTLYNGQQTANRTRAAESQVSGAREALRVLEQTVLLQAATIYMDYLRDDDIVEVQLSNTRVLEETLNQTRDRFNAGEVTRTDVAQSEAQLAAGRTQLLTAQSNLNTTRSNFRRIIGNDPQNLVPGSPVVRLLPPTLPGAVDIGLVENPNVTAALFGVDVNFLQVKVNEGALLPTVNVQLTAQQAYDQVIGTPRTFTASAIAQVTVPIFQGGAEYSMIRQSKENLVQQRLVVDQTRDQVRANIVAAWGQLAATKAQVGSAQAQVTASETALDGVRQEAKAGQRTTLDVLNAVQALVNARVALVTAQHDYVVASYSVLNTVGRLSPQVLNLKTNVYDPSVHYQQVRDSWIGVRTPDGQ
jgi:outer membrane protein